MPPSARELITQSQKERPELALLAEDHERHILDAPVQGTPISAGPDGVTVRTSNGGELLVRNTAQNFNPSEGESYQLRLSPGQASLVANSIASPQSSQATANKLIVQTRSPTAEDGGIAGMQWLDVSLGVVGGDLSAELWIYLPQYGAYVKAGGSGGVTIQDEGTALPPQGTVNFTGNGVTATDDAANNRTNVAIPLYQPLVADFNATEAPAGRFVGDILWYETSNGLFLAMWNADNEWQPADFCTSTCDDPPLGFNVTEIAAIFITGAGAGWNDGCSRNEPFEQSVGLEIDPGSETFRYDNQETGTPGIFEEKALIDYTINGQAMTHEFYGHLYDGDAGGLGLQEGPYSLCGAQYEYNRYYRA